jgi:hypothetical protein
MHRKDLFLLVRSRRIIFIPNESRENGILSGIRRGRRQNEIPRKRFQFPAAITWRFITEISEILRHADITGGNARVDSRHVAKSSHNT